MTPAEICIAVTGRTLADATQFVTHVGATLRVSSEDGKPRVLIQNLNPNRINVAIMAGIVINATPG